MSVFCSRIQVRIPHCIQSSGHLKNFSLWFVRVSQSFLIFHHLDSFEEYLSCILWNLLQFGFVSFSYDYTWVMGFWKEYHKGEVPFSSRVRKSCYQHDLITRDVDFVHMIKSLFHSRSFTFQIQIQYLFQVMFYIKYEVQVKDFFVFLHVDVQLFPHRLWKIVFFLHYLTCASLLKIIWLYLCRFMSGCFWFLQFYNKSLK